MQEIVRTSATRAHVETLTLKRRKKSVKIEGQNIIYQFAGLETLKMCEKKCF